MVWCILDWNIDFSLEVTRKKAPLCYTASIRLQKLGPFTDRYQLTWNGFEFYYTRWIVNTPRNSYDLVVECVKAAYS
jgi:hypothetical protein